MPLGFIYLKDFRLFRDEKFNFSPTNTVLIGKNGSGKTTILEALNVLLAGKSHRCNEIKECIREGSTGFKVAIKSTQNLEETTAIATKEHNKRVTINRKKGKKAGRRDDFPLPILILPSNLRMIEGEPELRRDFFNNFMFHVEQDAKEVELSYKRALSQRNKALKVSFSKKEILIWTDRLEETGKELNLKHKLFFNKFKNSTLESICKLNKLENLSFLEGLDFKFNQGWENRKEFRNVLKENFERDKAIGFTTNGPHRCDLIINLKNKKANSVLSRGQQKLLILLIFFNLESLLIKAHKGGVVFLIDDICSEMDEFNFNVLLKELKSLKSQALLTMVEGTFSQKVTTILDKFKQINL